MKRTGKWRLQTSEKHHGFFIAVFTGNFYMGKLKVFSCVSLGLIRGKKKTRNDKNSLNNWWDILYTTRFHGLNHWKTSETEIHLWMASWLSRSTMRETVFQPLTAPEFTGSRSENHGEWSNSKAFFRGNRTDVSPNMDRGSLLSTIYRRWILLCSHPQ